MRRREFISLIGGAAVLPLAVRAQQRDRVKYVGVLWGLAENDNVYEPYLSTFKQRLQDLGWIDGRNVRVEYRFTGEVTERIRVAARELVALAPDVIFATTNPAVAALLQETRTVPIVFTLVSNSIGSGFVPSLAHPGGNMTGFHNFEPDLSGKWLEILKEVAPEVRRVAFLHHPQTAAHIRFLRVGRGHSNSGCRTGMPFGFVTLLGLIALGGMIIRNTVILVDQIEQDVAAGSTRREAIIEATVRRARPVVLTALAAILAMIPLSRSGFWGSMAVTIMGGLLVATALTILFLPALYALWFRHSIDAVGAGTAHPDTPYGVRIWVWIRKMAAQLADLARGVFIKPKPHEVALLAALIVLAIAGTTAAAEQGTWEERRACTPDVFQHCSEFIPDPNRITVCLRYKLRELSPECHAVMMRPKGNWAGGQINYAKSTVIYSLRVWSNSVWQ